MDCNGLQLGIPDDCDIAGGNSFDCNSNGTPDDARRLQLQRRAQTTATSPFRHEPGLQL